jgi:hypothetical protein
MFWDACNPYRGAGHSSRDRDAGAAHLHADARAQSDQHCNAVTQPHRYAYADAHGDRDAARGSRAE